MSINSKRKGVVFVEHHRLVADWTQSAENWEVDDVYAERSSEGISNTQTILKMQMLKS